jgi:organic hydroperoxide reductase OsmC/OhrA
MKTNRHNYTLELNWTGNTGDSTSSYSSYERSYIIQTENKSQLEGSSDPVFRGDSSKYNPEELFLAAVSSCHMLWYLHLCSEEGILVKTYQDKPEGRMSLNSNGSGQFDKITLKPKITIGNSSSEMLKKAERLHEKANEMCFIANSCNFEIVHEPVVSFLTSS